MESLQQRTRKRASDSERGNVICRGASMIEFTSWTKRPFLGAVSQSIQCGMMFKNIANIPHLTSSFVSKSCIATCIMLFNQLHCLTRCQFDNSQADTVVRSRAGGVNWSDRDLIG